MGTRITAWPRSLPSVVAVLVCVGCTASGSAVPSAAGSSPVSRPDAQGRISAAIDAWVPLGHRDQLRGVVVSVNGHTVAEWYSEGTSAGQARDVESVTKSVMSALVGIAIGEGKIAGVEETLGQLLPGYARTMRPLVRAITLRELLTMTAGATDSVVNNTDFMKSPDWTAAILREADPTLAGTFHYANASAHLLSAILETATGVKVLDYARVKLFDPLGIVSRPALEPLADPTNFGAYQAASFAWPVDPQGHQIGWALLTLRPSDMAKIGELYRLGGRWQGRQILPASWVKQSTTGLVDAQGAGESYGYLWWVGTSAGKPAYRADGAGGQLIEVVPARGLVVAVSSQVNATDPSDNGVSYPDVAALVDSVITPQLDG
jgi:CubicO group peptidase (beta-lactamase class C family)